MNALPSRPARGGRRSYGRYVADGQLGQVLSQCAGDGWSGALRVAGEPGGLVHFAAGGIVDIETPGAPGPDVVLLRSGQIPEAGWEAAFTSAAPSGQLFPELVRRRLIGAARLEAVLRTALADAMFVLAIGRVEECHREEPTARPLLWLEPGAEPEWLLAETSRRLKVLASLGSQIVHDRDRVTAGRWPLAPRLPLSEGQYDILALANGRRTARDMAFALGRGVYALTLELSQMHEFGLLTVGSRRNETPAGNAWPDGSLVQLRDAQTPARPASAGSNPASPLPQRRAARQSAEPQSPGAVAPQAASALLRILRGGLADPPGPGNADEIADPGGV